MDEKRVSRKQAPLGAPHSIKEAYLGRCGGHGEQA